MLKKVLLLAFILLSFGVIWVQGQTFLPTPTIATILTGSVCANVAPLAPANPAFIHPDAEVRYA